MMPSRVKSSEPAICMFNYECTRRNGEVIGACMDGFLFGACCQLPPKNLMNSNSGSLGTEELLQLHQIDHVPDIPILLNSDGTPVGMSIPSIGETTKINKPNIPSHLNSGETTYTSSSNQDSASSDIVNNAEKTQLLQQADISHLVDDFPALLGQQDIIDDLRLPGLLTHSESNNDIQDHQDSSAMNPITTLLSPNQILQIADPVDQLPALFSHGLSNNHSDPETILLNENGTMLEETNNPDEIFLPSTETTVSEITQSAAGTSDTWIKFPEQPTSSTMELTSQAPKSTPAVITKMPIVTQMYNTQKLTSDPPSTQLTMTSTFQKINTIEKKSSTTSMKPEITTPMSTTNVKDELVRIPTITYDVPSGGNKKKDDVLDKEEIAINHIISILNDTTPNSEVSVTLPVPNSSPVQTWVSIDETSKPSHHMKIDYSSHRPTMPTTSTFPYTFYKPGSLHRPSSTYYNYELVPTETTYTSQHSTLSSSYASRPSTQTTYLGSSNSSFGSYSSNRPTTNPPAPTVIVLAPLGTEYTQKTTQKPITRKPSGTTAKPIGPIKTTPIRPVTLITKKPSVTTTITHNVSTIISNNVATNNVVSTSYISVNLKEDTSAKPVIGPMSTEAIAPGIGNTKERPSTKKPVIWTTMSSWSNKPMFILKPSTPSFSWSTDNLMPISTVSPKDTINDNTESTKITTSTVPCDEETAAPDDLINFPPVRNPNLNISASISQQEKPTIVETYNNTGYPEIELISENDIPTPTFVEDDVLTNKVDAFVNKIVESLQGNFQVMMK